MYNNCSKQVIEFDDTLKNKHINFQNEVDFYVEGKPRGKERPRTRRFKNFITTYTPENTMQYEKNVRDAYMDSVGNIQLKGSISADLLAVFPVPKQASKRTKELMLNGDIKYTKKPDTDNVIKIILDSLNQIAYHDDAQIVEVKLRKEYGETPMVRVHLKEVS